MKTKNQRNRGKQGTTLVEMLAAVIIVSIVVVGVLQFLIISRLNIYTANIRGGMVQLLSDTIVQNQFIPPGTSEPQSHTYDLAELGRYYRRYEALMAHWSRVLPPGRILDVRYEDVVANLEGEARRIIDHCRLPWDSRCLDFHRTERLVRTASAAQVRQPIYTTSIGRHHGHEAGIAPLLAELSDAAPPLRVAS